jgi:hypothetical protein
MCVQIWETSLDQSFQLVELQVKMLEMFSKGEFLGLEVVSTQKRSKCSQKDTYITCTYTVTGIEKKSKETSKRVGIQLSKYTL